MSYPVLLFDIDGTLVHAAGAGRRALDRALCDHLGAEADWASRGAVLRELRLDGMTDRLIVREAMALLGAAFDEAACARVLATYVRHLREEIRAPGYRVLPGVEALLPELARRGAVLGLCTGNVVEGARIKLARGGIDHHFGFEGAAVYGFAADGEARERIVEAAVRRAGDRIGRRISPREAIVIGDTPRDVEAAKHVGCPVLAVATGRFTPAELAACGADFVFSTLDEAEVVALLAG